LHRPGQTFRVATDAAERSALKVAKASSSSIAGNTEDRVCAHVFICMLALYLVWHLRRAWAPLCFSDEVPPERTDPVAPAKRSAAALAKVYRHTEEAGEALHSFSTLLDDLATLTRNNIVFASGARTSKLAIPTPLQRRAFELIGEPAPIELKPM
jgi:hypothetical protein